jgi:excisionase family DNA binding protein
MSIERRVKQKRLKKKTERGTGLPLVVLDPESVADVPASVALARVIEPTGVAAQFGSARSGMEAAFLTFLQSKAASSGVPVERRLFLTLAESAEFSGLPATLLRELIACGKLKALKTGAGWRVPRVEIEKLPTTLAEAPEQLEEHALRDIEENRRRRQGTAPQTPWPVE